MEKARAKAQEGDLPTTQDISPLTEGEINRMNEIVHDIEATERKLRELYSHLTPVIDKVEKDYSMVSQMRFDLKNAIGARKYSSLVSKLRKEKRERENPSRNRW